MRENFARAYTYYVTGSDTTSYEKRAFEKLMKLIEPIYYRQEDDITQGSLYFYTPKDCEETPEWVYNVEEIVIEGVDNNVFRFFK